MGTLHKWNLEWSRLNWIRGLKRGREHKRESHYLICPVCCLVLSLHLSWGPYVKQSLLEEDKMPAPSAGTPPPSACQSSVGSRAGPYSTDRPLVPWGLLPGSWVPSYQVSKLPQDVAAHFDQVFMTCWSLQCL